MSGEGSIADITEAMQEGLVYLSANEFKLAEGCYARALDMSELAFGESHFTTKKSLECMARCLMKQKDLALAVPMYERLVAIHDASGSGGEGDMASVFVELGECLVEVGREEDGRRMMSRGDKMLNVLQERVEEMEREEKEDDGEEEDGDEKDDDDEEESQDDDEENKGSDNRQWKV
mmetsp:Transcript_14413/g.28689  ORF Transcript_14413/g.28689 Transcript_14413/m.28689 type:complete len:177 (+) Transcript_14413:143-673(+)